MLREDKEVLKTCVILVLLGLLITAFFMIEIQESRVTKLGKENEELYKELFIGQGDLTNEKQIQDNSE